MRYINLRFYLLTYLLTLLIAKGRQRLIVSTNLGDTLILFGFCVQQQPGITILKLQNSSANLHKIPENSRYRK